MKRRWFLWFGAALLVTLGLGEGCSSSPASRPGAEAPDAKDNYKDVPEMPRKDMFADELIPAEDYTIIVGDHLVVEVFEHPEASHEFTVPLSRKYIYPMIRDLEVAGKTVGELQEEIQRRLDQRFIINPQVRVTVDRFSERKIYLQGEVGKAGEISLDPTRRTSLVQVLIQHGWISPSADAEHIKVLRHNEGTGEREMFMVSLPDVLKGEAVSREKNIVLLPGDLIIVGTKGFVYVVGAVQKPGRYVMPTGSMVYDTILQAGDITPFASKKVKLLRRGEKDQDEAFWLSYEEIKFRRGDVPVRPGDVIEVAESFF